jgi:hypothetical protein
VCIYDGVSMVCNDDGYGGIAVKLEAHVGGPVSESFMTQAASRRSGIGKVR